jgi:DNA-binding MarR family transcriptional regulator
VNDNNSKTQSKREPFCWIEKRKLRMIADVFSEGTGSVNSARSLYLALAEIASDKQRDRFDASQAEIAHRAGLSVASVKRILPVFRRLGLIKIKHNSTNGIQTRSTYTLIRGALAHGELALAQQPKTKRATEEESSEETFEGTARMKKAVSSSTCDNSLAEESADLVARSTPSPNEPHIVLTPTGERFNTKTREHEW